MLTQSTKPQPSRAQGASSLRPHSGHDSSRYATVTAGILAAGAGAEATRLVLQIPWQGWSPWFSYVISSILTTVWSTAAVTILMRHRARRIATAAWLLTFLATFTMIAHGLFARAGGAPIGLVFVPAGLLVGFCLKRMWDGSEFRWLKRTTATTRGAHSQPASSSRGSPSSSNAL